MLLTKTKNTQNLKNKVKKKNIFVILYFSKIKDKREENLFVVFELFKNRQTNENIFDFSSFSQSRKEQY